LEWTEEHVEAYDRRLSIGTRQRVWLDVLLYTGLRRGDAFRFGRQHVRDGVGTLKTGKSGFTVTVTLPILPVLAQTLAAGPCDDLTFIAGERGQPFTKESFGTAFRAPAVPLALQGPHMASVKLLLRRRRTATRPLRNLKRFSDGMVVRWLRSIRGAATDNVSPSKPGTS
jgi:integrase